MSMMKDKSGEFSISLVLHNDLRAIKKIRYPPTNKKSPGIQQRLGLGIFHFCGGRWILSQLV